MSKKKKNVAEAAENNDDFLAQEAKEMEEQAPEYTLDIPEDEIWTYQIESIIHMLMRRNQRLRLLPYFLWQFRSVFSSHSEP